MSEGQEMSGAEFSLRSLLKQWREEAGDENDPGCGCALTYCADELEKMVVTLYE